VNQGKTKTHFRRRIDDVLNLHLVNFEQNKTKRRCTLNSNAHIRE